MIEKINLINIFVIIRFISNKSFEGDPDKLIKPSNPILSKNVKKEKKISLTLNKSMQIEPLRQPPTIN